MGTNEKRQSVIDFNSILLSMISEKRFLQEEQMGSLIQKEQARVIRSFQSMYILSINCSNIAHCCNDQILKNQIVLYFNRIKKVEENIRESDIIGWIKKNETVGIVFLDVKKNCEKILEKKVRDIYNIQSDNQLPELEIKTAMYPMIMHCDDTLTEEIRPLENLKKKSRSMNQE